MKNLLYLSLLFFLIACVPNSNGIEYGQLDGIHYTNDQFNLNIELLEGWHFIKAQNNRQFGENNLKNIFGDAAVAEKNTKHVLENAALIFTLLKYDPKEGRAINPNMTITASNISETPQLANLDHAIQLAQEGFMQSGLDIQFQEELFDYEINQKNFRAFKYRVINDFGEAYYESYLGNYGIYNLLITISFADEAEREELSGIIASIKEI